MAHVRPEAAQSTSRILYGCVVVLTVLASLGEDPVHPLQDLVMVWIAVVGVALTEAWSEIIVKEANLGHHAYWPEIAVALRHSMWTLTAAIVPTVSLLMLATRQTSVAMAYDVSNTATVIFMFLCAARSQWLTGAGLLRSGVTGLVASGIGLGIVQVRTLVH
jgi:hypothetical protein